LPVAPGHPAGRKNSSEEVGTCSLARVSMSTGGPYHEVFATARGRHACSGKPPWLTATAPITCIGTSL
jgi:hypothetical protein